MKKENVLGYMFSRGSRCYKKAISQEIEKFDLTAVQCGVIRILKNYGTMTQAELAEAYASDRATIGSVVQKLQEKNYLEKKLSGNDRRAYVVSLTPKARKIADEMEEISNNIEKKALEGLTQEDIQTFYKVLDTMYRNLSKEDI